MKKKTSLEINESRGSSVSKEEMKEDIDPFKEFSRSQ